MKKLIYTILAVSTIFTSCTKDDEKDDEVEKASIVGVWSAKSLEVDIFNSVKMDMGIPGSSEEDTSYTLLPGDEGWDLDDDIEFTADGKMVEGVDTSSYSYSGNVLIVLDEEASADTFQCFVTTTTLEIIYEEKGEELFDGGSYSYNYKQILNANRN
jgi:hypothetical protein